MSGRGKKQTGPKCLFAYLVEVQESDGTTAVPRDYSHLVRKCIEDKIFSENPDHTAICRSDTTSSFTFVSYDWLGLRKALEILNETHDSGEKSAENPVTCITNIIKAMDAQMDEHTYTDRRILFFATLSSYILDEKEVIQVADRLIAKETYLSIVLPNKEDMTDIQIQNSKLLKKIFNQEKYEDISCVMNLRRAQVQILNTQSKKLTRPSPWNCPLEITSKISINVAGYVCTRSNKVSEMKKVFIKQGLYHPTSSQSTGVATPSSSSAIDDNEPRAANGTSQALALVVANQNASEPPMNMDVEEAKQVIEKETFWTSKDGQRVEEDDIGKGFYYGDKLVQLSDDVESYRTGEKCLKLLAFCPIENINSALLVGDGTTLFYPRKDDLGAEVVFNALLKSMANLRRVAIVRKVYRRDSKAVLGSLYPDVERGCLVLNELSYADDISIPYFPPLIKPEEMADDEDASAVISEREELIDELIRQKSLDAYHPLSGPADPAVASLRDTVSSKILKVSPDSREKSRDNIDLYFQTLVLDGNFVSKLRDAFPLQENKAIESRPAGGDVFRKRILDTSSEMEVEKKPKLEADENIGAEGANQEDNFEDLLDEF